ncbi:MAG TPA: VOC family protein [Dermatophilaceae bacterium]|nr:VOC family protein [Dermatophilaceae bacterium]
MASIEPELWVERAASAARFYSDAFGATVVFQVGEGEDVVTRLDVDGARFWVAAADSRIRRRAPDEFQGATGRVLLVLPDPAAVVVAAEAAGATATAEVTEEHGWLLGRIVDPFGHEWEIGRHLAD